MNQVTIYDTTLRDGAQAEGINFSIMDKLFIARRLDSLGIHFIEGGWPNPKNHKDVEFFAAVRDERFENSVITAFGSTRKTGIDASEDANLNALIEAKTEVVTLFGKTWDLHVKAVLRCSPEENLRMIEDSIRYLKRKGRRVIYDAEHFFDGYKADPVYAVKTLHAAADAGAEILVLCDTNGGMLPLEFKNILEGVKNEVETPLGIHTHNDSGLASSLSIIAVQLGMHHVQGTINGLGERCGNDNLCTTIPNIKLKLGMDCMSDEHLLELMDVSRYVNEIANISHNFCQPYVGESAFAHKGGAHVDGVLKDNRTFEHIDPSFVGNKQRILISDQSGSSAVMAKLRQMYPELEKKGPDVEKVLSRIKNMEKEGYQFEAAQGSFELLSRKLIEGEKEFFTLVEFRVINERHESGEILSEATIKVIVDGKKEHTAADGNGPVNALDNALRKALEKFFPQLKDVYLEDYKVRVLSSHEGTESRVRVLIESSDGKDVWGTVGVSKNVIEASWIALADSLSYKLLLDEKNLKKNK